ncbi:ATP-binding/permease protein CydD [Planococcus massiliensis]|uniref:ATP-binding/permease protein CydD n=1 Tax=Planococcus massiliensis TaxID=1499687 RepID=A0A098EQL6_9BACL|nr:thiol reductant ABC exporter subunit CydD [Planococcus massiliensis]CEG24075.1 ATP-binding/permease protein CydD [Planococcus massiliensis]
MLDLKQLAYERKNRMAWLIVASLLKGVAMIGQALFFVWIADAVFLKDASFREVLPYFWGLLAAILIRAASGYAIGRTGVNLASEAKSTLRTKLTASFAGNPLQASVQGQSGEKVSLLLDAVDEVDGYFSKYIPQMVQSAIIPVLLLIVIFSQHWVTGLIILITAPFIPVFMALVGIKTKEKADAQMEKLGRFSGTFLDVLQGLTTLKLFGRAEQQKQVIKKSSLDFRDATMEVLKSAFLSSLMLEYISMLSMGIIALEIGLRLVVYDNLTFFTAFFVMILVPDFFNLLKDFGSAFHTGRGSAAAAKRLAAELEKEQRPVAFGQAEMPEQPFAINVNALSFQYEDGFGLGPIEIAASPGSRLAIIGKSGSGKTTLLHAIAGLLPLQDGQILVNGIPRSEIAETSWFDHLSYISQNPYLFAGTIKENILIGTSRQTSEEELTEAARKAGILEMVYSLKQGFETPVGEAGRGLSGGEKQRIALARAFLKKPSLILFDEPTSGLDLYTEKVLQEAIEELGRDATIVTVAHRLHTVRNSDVILVLADGKAAAKGSHEELLETYSPYREMLAIQQGGVLQ